MLVRVTGKVRDSFNLTQCIEPRSYRRAKLFAPRLDGERTLETPKYKRIENLDGQMAARNQEINEAVQAGDALGNNDTICPQYGLEVGELGRRKLFAFYPRQHLREQF